MIIEPPFKNKQTLTRPNIPNMIYGPHYYDWRFIMDEVYIQLQYAFQNGGLTSALNAFVTTPTTATRDNLVAQLQFILVATDKLTEWMGNGVSGSSVTSYLSEASAIQSSLTSYQTMAATLLSNPDRTALSSFSSSVTNFANTLNVQLFTPSTGLFPVLAPTLSAGAPNTDAPMTSMVTDSAALGSVPVILGEFGCDGAAMFIDCPGWVWSMTSSAETQLAAGYAQWLYAPQWTPQLGDIFNLESLSITTGVQGGFQPRATMMVGRPHVRKVAGIPTAVQVGRSPISLSVTYTTSATTNSTTELFFDVSAACGTTASNIVVTPAAAVCSTAQNPLISCDSSALPANTAVTVTISC
ncbi:hypothetical protein M427DRAFT_53085 [Gonapodya prolifera JEL478]|uniref:Glycoside hydrolase family 5 protein n=1 Tax=Gonapodya prolifera (strain JEL478) TaxID=1344416 RepID=A0A139AQV7_GONPJ|nr:hypothetical protein M427DRAFT_53085 [Gonapodya prolifera JEL478]|eukprot:KXS19102.1 hypothetical protein M427DRAFT_53085 [Gonapodya prolifera JEL478]